VKLGEVECVAAIPRFDDLFEHHVATPTTGPVLALSELRLEGDVERFCFRTEGAQAWTVISALLCSLFGTFDHWGTCDEDVLPNIIERESVVEDVVFDFLWER
jgi:hypothetical protein